MKRYMTKTETLLCFRQLWNLQPDTERNNKDHKKAFWAKFIKSLLDMDNISNKQYENLQTHF